jgi:hypothetical protein
MKQKFSRTIVNPLKTLRHPEAAGSRLRRYFVGRARRLLSTDASARHPYHRGWGRPFSPLHHFLWLTSGCLLLCLSANGQTPSPSPTPDVPRAKVSEVRKLPTGAFLFAVRLYASPSKPLKLMRPPAKIPPGHPRQEGDDDPLPFSLAGSTLKDLITGTVHNAYPLVPNEPYFGPIDVTGNLAPGGWMQLGVAFPPIPEPPPDEKGQKQPYRLLFSVPELKIETLVTLDPVTLKPILKDVKSQ